MPIPPPGRRVVVRYLLPTGQATDALGVLLRADATTVVVDGKRGVETIAVADIVAAKEVPPPPAPRSPGARFRGEDQELCDSERDAGGAEVLKNQSDEVDLFMQTLDHPLTSTIQDIRLRILENEPALAERIKWNAPSFSLHGVDRITFNLRPQDKIQLVFHRGVKPIEDSSPFRFEDRTGLLTLITAERGQVTLKDAAAVAVNRQGLTDLVHDWLRA